MRKYENGAKTRQIILNTCKKMFYEKGFRSTGAAEVCSAAYVNRNALYYHFKDMENLRYEVFWEYFIANRRYVERHCPQKELHTILAVYYLWVWILQDEKFRRFTVEYLSDYPVYKPNTGPGRFFLTTFDQMYGSFLKADAIEPLSFSSVYGHIIGVVQLANEHPDWYSPETLFRHCIISGMNIWGISKDEAENYWQTLVPYIQSISVEEMALEVFHRTEG